MILLMWSKIKRIAAISKFWKVILLIYKTRLLNRMLKRNRSTKNINQWKLSLWRMQNNLYFMKIKIKLWKENLKDMKDWLKNCNMNLRRLFPIMRKKLQEWQLLPIISSQERLKNIKQQLPFWILNWRWIKIRPIELRRTTSKRLRH